MPSYDFACEHCRHFWKDQWFSMSDQLPQVCPECGSTEPDFHQVYGAPLVVIKGNPTTFGQQAEINARRVGKEQMAKMTEDAKVRKRKGRRALNLPGASRIEAPAGKPWWRDSDKPLDLKKIKDPVKYIRTGATT